MNENSFINPRCSDVLGAVATAADVGITAAGCATVATGVGAAFCLGGAASSSVGVGLTVDSFVN